MEATPLVLRAPRHVAIILDGNRRWATERGLPKFLGHTEGAKNLKRVVEAALGAGIEYLTVYTLSSENLTGRSAQELAHLFSLFERLKDYAGLFHERKVRLRTIGDLAKLPQRVQDALARLCDETQEYTRLTLTLAIGYGGRDEIVRAARRLVSEGVRPEEITEESFAQHLDTAGMPEVDLVIRTGGHSRLSNYLPWQSTYAELYFTPVFWPDFSEEELQRAIAWFCEQQRNRGK